MVRALQLQELAALKADIDKGLADLAEGRVQDFDADRIIARGRKLLDFGATDALYFPQGRRTFEPQYEFTTG